MVVLSYQEQEGENTQGDGEAPRRRRGPYRRRYRNNRPREGEENKENRVENGEQEEGNQQGYQPRYRRRRPRRTPKEEVS